MNDDELLPCPFCGGDATVSSHAAPVAFVGCVLAAYVRCNACGAKGAEHGCKGGQKNLEAARRKAARSWNERLAQ